MSRYIDVDALPWHRRRGSLVTWKDIENAPSIDIVRCGECKHWMNEHLCQWWSRYGTIETDADDYCSYGERKESKR